MIECFKFEHCPKQRSNWITIINILYYNFLSILHSIYVSVLWLRNFIVFQEMHLFSGRMIAPWIRYMYITRSAGEF